MIDTVKEILGKSVEEVIASSTSLKLLRCYSLLYNNGNEVRWCAAYQREYYSQLSINGILMAEKFDETNKRTLQPAWDGLKYIHSEGGHYNSLLITDEQAIRLLNEGKLRESDFVKLPEGFKKLEEKQTKKVKK